MLTMRVSLRMPSQPNSVSFVQAAANSFAKSSYPPKPRHNNNKKTNMKLKENEEKVGKTWRCTNEDTERKRKKMNTYLILGVFDHDRAERAIGDERQVGGEHPTGTNAQVNDKSLGNEDSPTPNAVALGVASSQIQTKQSQSQVMGTHMSSPVVSSYWRGPFHSLPLWVRLMYQGCSVSKTKYWLEKVVGAFVHGPQ